MCRSVPIESKIGRGKKTLEAQGDPFRRGLPTLQTSLTYPELPHKTPAITRAMMLFRFCDGGGLVRKFLVWIGRNFFESAAIALV